MLTKTLEIPSTLIEVDGQVFRLSVDTLADYDLLESLYNRFQASLAVYLAAVDADPAAPDVVAAAEVEMRRAACDLMRWVLRADQDGKPTDLSDTWLIEHVFAHLTRADEILGHQLALAQPRGILGRAVLAMRRRSAAPSSEGG